MEPRAAGRRAVRARRHVRRPDPEPRARAGQAARRRHLPHLRDRQQRRRSSRASAREYSDTGPTGTAPSDPTILPELADASSPSSTRCRRRSRSTRRGTPARAREWDGQTLETWVARQQPQPSASARCCPVATPPDLRRRGARPLPALHALLHRRVGRRAQRRHVRPQLQHPQRRAAVALRRAARRPSRSTSRPSWGRSASSLNSPVRRIEQNATGVTVRTDKHVLAGNHVIVADPADAGRADRLHAGDADGARPADAAPRPGLADRRWRPPTTGRSGARRASTARR